MAGSGKTTLLQRINSELHIRKTPGYIVNLDPAVLNVPYSPNVDIRDTVRARSIGQGLVGWSAGYWFRRATRHDRRKGSPLRVPWLTPWWRGRLQRRPWLEIEAP